MMLILVKGDDVRSGREAKARHGRLQPAQDSVWTLLFFGHFNLSKNIKQTAVINITRQRML